MPVSSPFWSGLVSKLLRMGFISINDESLVLKKLKKQERQAVFFQQALWLTFVIQMFILRVIEKIINNLFAASCQGRQPKSNPSVDSFMSKSGRAEHKMHKTI